MIGFIIWLAGLILTVRTDGFGNLETECRYGKEIVGHHPDCADIVDRAGILLFLWEGKNGRLAQMTFFYK